MPLNLTQEMREIIKGRRALQHTDLNALLGGQDPDANPLSIEAKLTPTTPAETHRGLSTNDFAETLTFDANLRLGTSGEKINPALVRGVLSGMLDVIQGGAVGDGVTNDRAAIQSVETTLLESFAENGSSNEDYRANTVWFPPIRGKTFMYDGSPPYNIYGGLVYRGFQITPLVRGDADAATEYFFRPSFSYNSPGHGVVDLPKVLHLSGMWWDGKRLYDKCLELLSGNPADVVILEDCYFGNWNRTNGEGYCITSNASWLVLRNCVFVNPIGVLSIVGGQVSVEDCMVVFDDQHIPGLSVQTLFSIENGVLGHCSFRNLLVAEPAGNSQQTIVVYSDALSENVLIEDVNVRGLRVNDSVGAYIGGKHNIVSRMRVTAYSSTDSYGLGPAFESRGSYNIFAHCSAIGSESRSSGFEAAVVTTNALAHGGHVIEGMMAGPNAGSGVVTNSRVNPIDAADPPDIEYVGYAKNYMARTDLRALADAPLSQEEIQLDWEPVGAGMNDDVYDFAVYHNELIAAGAFTQSGAFYGKNVGGILQRGVMRVATLRGGQWEPIEHGFDDEVYALQVFPQLDWLVAMGKFTERPDSFRTYNQIAYAVKSLDKWLPFPATGGGVTNGPNRAIKSIAGPFGQHYWIVGNFTQLTDELGSVNYRRFASIRISPENPASRATFEGYWLERGGDDVNFGPDVGPGVVHQHGTGVWIGGQFTHIDTDTASGPTFQFEGGASGNIPVQCVAYWNQQKKTWAYLGPYNASGTYITGVAHPERGAGSSPAEVFAFASHAGRTLIGGDFSALQNNDSSYERDYHNLIIRGRWEELGEPSIQRPGGSDGLPSPVRHIVKLSTGLSVPGAETWEGSRFLICCDDQLFLLAFTGESFLSHKIIKVSTPTPAGYSTGVGQYIAKTVIWKDGAKNYLVVGGRFIEGTSRTSEEAFGQSMNLEVKKAVPYLTAR